PETAQLQKLFIPGRGRGAGVQQRNRCRLVLRDGLMQIVGPVEERLRIVCSVRGSAKGIDLFAIRGGKTDYGGGIRRQHRFVERDEQCSTQTDAIEQKRKLGMCREALPPENADFLPKHLLVSRQPLVQVPQLRLDRQEGVFSFHIWTTADFDDLALDA